jgi:hypothetical protein
MIFTDGQIIGAKLDRNGLRPLRYTLTSDGLLIVASEVGITDLSGKEIVERQRLGPGEMLIADPASGTFFRPNEVGGLVRAEKRQPTTSVIPARHRPAPTTLDTNRLMAAFGWTEDQFRMLFQPLVEHGQEPLWSMGDDAPPAFLSSLPRPCSGYQPAHRSLAREPRNVARCLPWQEYEVALSAPGCRANGCDHGFAFAGSFRRHYL